MMIPKIEVPTSTESNHVVRYNARQLYAMQSKGCFVIATATSFFVTINYDLSIRLWVSNNMNRNKQLN